MNATIQRRLISGMVAITALLVAERTLAVVRSCGDDAVVNTETVLCASPSGPCTATEVVVAAHITVAEQRCVFDLGGRALRVERTFRMPKGLDTRFEVRNAGDVTIARRGRIKLRGDFPGPTTDWGGLIDITSAGAIAVAGVLDVSGDGGGLIALSAAGNVTFERRSKVRGRGISSFRDEGARFADGGQLLVDGAAIAVRAPLDFGGANAAAGGGVDFLAERGVEILARIDASGGDGAGGDFAITAADDVLIAASVDVSGRNGAGDGGDIDVVAGLDVRGPGDTDIGEFLGGALHVRGATLDARASALEGFGGFGGDVALAAGGDVTVDADVVIRADASPTGDSVGGSIFLLAGEDFSGVPRDGDLVTDAVISVRGPERGGTLALFGRDVTFRGAYDATGANGGFLAIEAGRDALVAAAVVARATAAVSVGPEVAVKAGQRANGTLRITRDMDLSGGTPEFGCAAVTFSGCALIVEPAVTIDAICPAPPGGITPSIIELVARYAMDLGAGSRYLAGPIGRVLTSHPVAVTPVIGLGTVFTAVRADNPNDGWPYQRCAP